ncbi:AAA family ATPase [Streptomyces sp. P9(2023)]|uniref:AAA family ATPase n=1 Tax=Streptomyces sp. P9(2023) TaxID=3064394 RepID=UPI0028F412C6|nr:AAA family ATPase [Streptomyces sp. P9(2023)]MDT9693638.1 AAA family ATPase [Streptomyces sp. P9(2023)]
MTVLTSYEDLHPSQQQAADELWNLFKTHAPALHAKLAWNFEDYLHPYHCGLVHDESDFASHNHEYHCLYTPQEIREDQRRLDAERAPRPFDGHWHDSESLDSIPPLEPLLEGVFYRKTLSRVVGHSASMKSFVLLSAAAHMGWGEPWFGCRVQEQGIRTLLVVAEGAEGIKARKLALEQHHGRELENVEFFTKAIQIDPSTREWQQFTAEIKRREIDLVIFDTQARCTSGLEENSNREMGQVVATLDKLIRETGASVCLVHHSTGDQSTTGNNLKARGAGAVRAALQSEVFVKRDRKLNLVTVSTDKAKDTASRSILLEPVVREIDGLTDWWGEKESSIVLLPPSPRIKGSVGVPADTESAVDTVESLAERFQQLSDNKPTVANVQNVLGIRRTKATDVARHLREQVEAA